MSERFSGGESYERRLVERDPILESLNVLNEIDVLLAKLVEKGGELTLAAKAAIRARIQQHLASLGLDNLEQLTEFSQFIHRSVNERRKQPKTPSHFPGEVEFSRSLRRVLTETQRSHLPSVWQGLTASEVAAFGQSNWRRLDGRGKSLGEYQYGLAMAMCDELLYTLQIKHDDPIKISDGWRVDNGRHRTLALRTLGENFVESAGLNNWVRVERA